MWREVAVPEEDESAAGERGGRVYGVVVGRSVLFACVLGALAIALLPLLGLVFKSITCGYGLDTDFSGVTLFLPIFMAVGAAVGAVAGLIGKVIGALTKGLAKIEKGPVIGAVLGDILAVGVAGYASIFIFAFFMIPDC